MTEKLNWALYIGQKIKTDSTLCMFGLDLLTGITYSEKGSAILHCKYGVYDTSLCECKPILRSLDQMTEDEKIELKHVIQNGAGKILPLKTSDNKNFSSNPADYNDLFPYSQITAIDWLTQKGFAIRGEFERGVAIKEGNK